MRSPTAPASLLVLLALSPLALAETPASEALDGYVRRPQPAYRWEVEGSEPQAGGVVLERITLVSQTWRGLEWRHRLNLLVPPPAEGTRARPGHAMLLITGSGGERDTAQVVAGVARQLGVPVAVLHDVPNQPLFAQESPNGKGYKEDALIALTFQKYAETGDRDWPALLPMTRAVVSAMDALGELSARRAAAADGWGFGKLERFVTLGGSKRGWTTWLSAVVDRRVIGIAPVVYDNLNIPEQLDLHFETWGHPSPSIHDYTERGLHALLRSERGRELLQMVDPYVYASRLTVPKMAVIGTNDTYWPLEAIHLYRGGLPGELYCHYVPNGGHQVGPSVVQAAIGFFDYVTGRIPSLPHVQLTLLPRHAASLSVADPEEAGRVRAVSLWGAHVPGRDFTQSQWTRVAAARDGAGWRAPLPEPCQAVAGRAAFIGEVELESSGGQRFTIHTPVQVWELGPTQ